MNEMNDLSAVFPQVAVNGFNTVYPNDHCKLQHTLDQHPLLELEALATLAETLPEKSIEYNKGALPIGVAAKDVPENGLTIGDTIRQIDSVASWAVLKNIEQSIAYKNLLHDLLGELEETVQATTGKMLKAEGYIFVSSPDAVTPFHFDPEHNILMQIRGEKNFHIFPAGDPRFAAHQEHERYHGGGHRNIPWEDGFENEGEVVHLAPGNAIYVPVMAPHYVKNGSVPSISLSITWRSQWSIDEANAYAFNKRVRKLGFPPSAPSRFPQNNRTRSVLERILRKIVGR